MGFSNLQQAFSLILWIEIVIYSAVFANCRAVQKCSFLEMKAHFSFDALHCHVHPIYEKIKQMCITQLHLVLYEFLTYASRFFFL